MSYTDIAGIRILYTFFFFFFVWMVQSFLLDISVFCMKYFDSFLKLLPLIIMYNVLYFSPNTEHSKVWILLPSVASKFGGHTGESIV